MFALGRVAVNYAAGILMGNIIYYYLNRIPISSRWTEKKVSVFISFDCDRTADSLAIPTLLSILDKHKLKASFAIVGELIGENIYVYQQLVDAGHEVLNHGYSRHTDEKSNSILFYNNLDKNALYEEIVKAQDTIESYIKVKPVGFRVPHFGTFQQKNMLEMLYGVLSQSGIAYSSSAMAYYLKRCYPSWKVNDIVEIPLSNRVLLPVSVLDSHSLIRQRKRVIFFREFKRMIDTALQSKVPVAVNFYVDPSHVVGCHDFAASLEYLAYHKEKLWIGCYKEILPFI